MASPVPIDLRDPTWFPADVDLGRELVAFLPIELRTVGRSTFMDTRMKVDASKGIALPRAWLEGEVSPAGRPGWLFHTSFCGSTLLAQAMHVPPECVALKEPLILRRLSDAVFEGQDIGAWLRPLVGLLGRPWSTRGGVVIKPTHAALNIAPSLMMSSPGSRGVVVTSSLEDFLVSNIKKTPETQSRIPLLCERAFKSVSTKRRFRPEALAPPTVLAAAGLQWALQRELVLDLIVAQPGTVKVVDTQVLMTDLPSVAIACHSFLGVAGDRRDVVENAVLVSQSHAKSPGSKYTAADREHEMNYLRRAYSPHLREAHAWLEAAVLPYLRPEAMTLSRGALSLDI